MKKTAKKIDKQLRESLTQVCEYSLEQYNGFQWLTHTVNYANFPKSLKIICIFDTEQNLKALLQSNAQLELNKQIQAALFKINITLPNATSQISYDSEEKCQQTHNGNWASRLGQ
ncbi:Fis family transcriptional regulator [Thalassotalea sp. G2M2-11]|uniref:Fis family transcriptional regulator n=1 Tax=Thalassotalea sp. G2M2-11 TaxID=2787627 RepID=UPI0019CFF670|nr:Fis family transcriptional regulator [Thalassotalea sp. G2M2-11]